MILKSSSSVRGIRMPDFEVLDARIASALNRIIHNSHFKEKGQSEGTKSPKGNQTVSCYRMVRCRRTDIARMVRCRRTTSHQPVSSLRAVLHTITMQLAVRCRHADVAQLQKPLWQPPPDLGGEIPHFNQELTSIEHLAPLIKQ